MRWKLALAVVCCLVTSPSAARAGDGNRLTYLDEFCHPYYVGRHFPRLSTPQWVGDPDVKAVVTLAIDDMRDTARYEAYLRPILERLKQIDGRAPVSIMTCNVDPADPQLAAWLAEGLSIEVHTVDHPCPLLQGGDLTRAKSTYDRCVDLMQSIPGNHAVAFRMPCCDSRNTPSPRFWTEIFNRTTGQGHFLQLDSSVFNITTPHDPDLPRELVLEPDGGERFRKYLPFPSFVNTIEDYPYPYVIGRLCWEFPCVVPSDWEAQNLHQPNNPRTVADLQAALDAAVLKQGVFNLVFHPHGWIRSDQVVELIDYAVSRYGKQVQFLTFAEAVERLNTNLLGGYPLRAPDGGDNGVRVLDLDNDGHLDVVIGNGKVQQTRLWLPREGQWQVGEFPVALVRRNDAGAVPSGTHFAVLRDDGAATVVGPRAEGWHFAEGAWQREERIWEGVPFNSLNASSSFRDLDGDGRTEMIEANWAQSNVYRWDPEERGWQRLPFVLPSGRPLYDEDAVADAGLRFIDVNGDGRDDLLHSDGRRFSLHLFENLERGWSIQVAGGRRNNPADGIPMLVRPDGTNNGGWFHSGHLWLQHEDSDRLPDGVQRLSFQEMLKGAGTAP